MAQLQLQEGGWPLGLGLIRNVDFSGSLSFGTRTTASPGSSVITSSDIDTESTGSFFHSRSVTFGSIIGITNILDPGRSPRSIRHFISKEKKYHKAKACFFSLCSRSRLDARTGGGAPSLGHFLEAERRAVDAQRRQPRVAYEIKGLPGIQHDPAPNSLFYRGHIVPPNPCGDGSSYGIGRSTGRGLNRVNDNGYWLPLVCPCMRS